MPDSAPPPAAAPQPDAPPRAASASAAALDRHARRLRPWRIAYAAGIVVVALALLTIVKIAYVHGEISHATLRTIPDASVPPSIAPQQPSPTLTRAWTSPDASALGAPFYDGTVVTWNEHTVRGRDAVSGTQTWSYTRSDRVLCTAMQVEGVTIAAYRLHGNCDELTGVDTRTGQRRWTRTLDKDSNQFDKSVHGTPHFLVGPVTVVVWTSSVIYAIDPSGDQDTGNKNGGIDRWVFTHAGCAIHNVALGLNGALISQTCTGQNCAGVKFCANGVQLLLRDALKGDDGNTSTNHGNPDQVIWLHRGLDMIPAAADQVIAAVSSDGTQLELFSPDKGVLKHELPLDGGHGKVASAAASDADLITFSGVTYAVSGSKIRWQAETANPPTVVAPNGAGTPSLAQARISYAGASAIATLSAVDGAVERRYPVGTPPRGLVFPVGAGFLVAGASTTVYR